VAVALVDGGVGGQEVQVTVVLMRKKKGENEGVRAERKRENGCMDGWKKKNTKTNSPLAVDVPHVHAQAARQDDGQRRVVVAAVPVFSLDVLKEREGERERDDGRVRGEEREGWERERE
jgi:hypothetical protein